MYGLFHTGKELAVYDLNEQNPLKMINLYGNGLIGRVNVSWTEMEGVDLETGEPMIYWNRSDERNYYIKDHLGSIRLTFDKNGEVVSAQSYYPFGEIMDEYVSGGSINNKYKFTEKERDIETGYDYFGARFYDSDLGRWLSIDPLADKYPGWSV